MFPGPVETRKFELVAALPAALRMGRSSAWADMALGGAVLDAFFEGPVCDATGNLFVTDIPFGRILCLTPQKQWSVVVTYDGWPNGMKLSANGDFIVADHRLGLLEIARATGVVRVLCDGFEGKPFHGLNDLTLSRGGDIYFTDQGRSGLEAPFGRVFRLARDGALSLLIDGVPSPNGLVLSQDESTLFLAVTRANAIWRLPLGADGVVHKAGLFIQMSGGVGPDGMVLVPETNGLLVAHPGLGLWAFGANGLPRGLWETPEFSYPTNLAADPLRRGSYYVTESLSASILRVSLA